MTPVAVAPTADPLMLTTTISASSTLPDEDKAASALRQHQSLENAKAAMLDSGETGLEDVDDDDKSINVSPLSLTLLLVSGLRGIVTIDREYMKGHSLGLREPESLTVLTLKECIWTDWKEEWGERPSSTEFIRLIHFGRLLDDKDTLGASQLSQANTYNVLHMSVRPVSIEGMNSSTRSGKDKTHNTTERTSRHRRESHNSTRINRQMEIVASTSETENARERSGGCGCVIL
ncbi:hypothetical protein V1512DRAFT_200944 [Lipomyces arxii]|uniref:uncharacterized protein n=1 Tax=Lipomyces arxii TaxID=56418 RepID=UPI0034D00EC5